MTQKSSRLSEVADFCHQCSIATFGEDYGDLANLFPDRPKPYTVDVICEGCGHATVDENGVCLKDHDHEWDG